MDRWSGKVAVVTGASAGIGSAICKALVNKGVKVAGLARRMEKLQELAGQLNSNLFYPIKCDVTNEEDILKAFRWVEKNLGGTDILVNNAGVAHIGSIIDTETSEYRKVLDTNLLAPAICAREAIQSIKKRNTLGHVININSVAGQFAEAIHLPIGMYGPSKYGLRALGTELRHEIVKAGLKVKITNISPGAVLTDMLTGLAQLPDYSSLPILKDSDIADAVVYVLGTPSTVEIPEITIVPQNEIIGVPRDMASLGKN